MKNILIIILVLAVLAVAGCQNIIFCSKPYIKEGNICCLDENSNSVCDSDEIKNETDPYVKIYKETDENKPEDQQTSCANKEVEYVEEVPYDECYMTYYDYQLINCRTESMEQRLANTPNAIVTGDNSRNTYVECRIKNLENISGEFSYTIFIENKFISKTQADKAWLVEEVAGGEEVVFDYIVYDRPISEYEFEMDIKAPQYEECSTLYKNVKKTRMQTVCE